MYGQMTNYSKTQAAHPIVPRPESKQEFFFFSPPVAQIDYISTWLVRFPSF